MWLQASFEKCIKRKREDASDGGGEGFWDVFILALISSTVEASSSHKSFPLLLKLPAALLFCSSCWSYSCSLPFVIRRRVFTRKTDGLVFRESQNTSFWSDYNLRYKSEEKTLESNCNHKEMNVIGGKKPGSFDRVVLLNQPLLWPYNFCLSC